MKKSFIIDYNEFGSFKILSQTKATTIAISTKKTSTSDEYLFKIFEFECCSSKDQKIVFDTFCNIFQMKYQYLQCYDHISFVYQSKFSPTFSMKYSQANTLDQVLKMSDLIKSWEIKDFIKCIFVISDAMLYLHDHLIIHGNLCPSNIIVVKKNQFYLRDFGLYPIKKLYLKENDLFNDIYRDPSMEKNNPTYKNDVYSFGVLMCELFFSYFKSKSDFNEQQNDLSNFIKIINTNKHIQSHNFFTKLISNCLNYEINERLSFKQILDLLKKTNESILNESIQNIYNDFFTTNSNEKISSNKTKQELNLEIRNKSHLIKQLKNKINANTSTANLPSTPSKCNQDIDLSKKTEYKINSNFPILNNIYENAMQHTKNYDMSTIQLANDIYSISPEAYKLLHENLNFPSKYIIDKYVGEDFKDLNDMFTNPEKAAEIISCWRQKNNVHGKFDACLSVDALYFHPLIEISKTLDISGMELPVEKVDELTYDLITTFQKKPRLFEDFIQKNSKYILRSAFVFQIQSLKENYPTFVIHLKPTFSGKANNQIIDLLKYFDGVSKNHNICIRSYSFDGDNGYQSLHELFFNSYYKTLFTRKNTFNVHIECKRIVGDPLHLFKRLRYRLFKNIIHVGFDLNSSFIDIQKLKDVLSYLPTAVFRDDALSKMHDSLPILLFSPKSLIILFENKMYTEMAYFFPIVTAIIGLSDDRLTVECRNYFFECSFWFLIKYYQLFKSAVESKKTILKQNKSKTDNNIMFYSEKICIQFTNTIFASIQLLDIIPNINFDRDSTMPLEHKFGMVRLRTKYINTLKKFQITLAQIQGFSFPKNECINGRKNSFGCIAQDIHGIYFDNDKRYKINDFSPNELVDNIFNISGFTNNCNQIQNSIEWFIEILNDLYPNDKNEKKKCSSYQVEAGIHQGFRANSLIKKQSQFTNFHSIEKIKSPYENFISFFFKKYKRKPNKKDLINITNHVKNKLGFEDIPQSNEKCEVFHQWFNDHYQEFEKFINNCEI